MSTVSYLIMLCLMISCSIMSTCVIRVVLRCYIASCLDFIALCVISYRLFKKLNMVQLMHMYKIILCQVVMSYRPQIISLCAVSNHNRQGITLI
jgi:hypothetical protein